MSCNKKKSHRRKQTTVEYVFFVGLEQTAPINTFRSTGLLCSLWLNRNMQDLLHKLNRLMYVGFRNFGAASAFLEEQGGPVLERRGFRRLRGPRAPERIRDLRQSPWVQAWTPPRPQLRQVRRHAPFFRSGAGRHYFLRSPPEYLDSVPLYAVSSIETELPSSPFHSAVVHHRVLFNYDPCNPSLHSLPSTSCWLACLTPDSARQSATWDAI
jgi:hypothetical protein